jgi:hypothetical protein
MQNKLLNPATIRRRVRELTEAVDKAKMRRDVGLAELRGRCPHVSVTYVPDWGGGNDYSHTCDHCGMTRHGSFGGEVK